MAIASVNCNGFNQLLNVEKLVAGIDVDGMQAGLELKVEG
jgi:hypothetical protein